jgi:hypothetical protein
MTSDKKTVRPTARQTVNLMRHFNCKCANCRWRMTFPITAYFGVIALFSSNFQTFNTFRPLFQKLLEIKVKFKLQKCAAYQDLPTLQFLSKSCYLMNPG